MLDLTPRLLDAVLTKRSPEEVAEALYGVAWSSSVRPLRSGDFHASRLPASRPAADFLRPLLADVLAHDGRSSGVRRTSGWWLREEESGGWLPVEPDDLAAPLADAVSEAYRCAVEIRDAAYVAHRAAEQRAYRAQERSPFARVDTSITASALTSARVLAAVLEAFLAVFNRPGRTLHETLNLLRRGPRALPPLPDAGLARIARDWLGEHVEDGSITLHGGRVSAADLSEILREEDDPSALPRPALFRGLDLALGVRRKSGSDRFWLWQEPTEDAA